LVQKSGLNERLNAFEAIRKWLTQGTFFKSQALSPFAMELSLGVCRHHLFFLYALKKNVRKMPELKTQILIEMGFYQLFYMDSVPDYAALSETVKTARLAEVGENNIKLITGVLRAVQKNGFPALPPQKVARISLQYSVPEWLVRLWLDEGGAEYAEARAQKTVEKPAQWIRVNTRKTTLESVRNEFRIQGREFGERFLEVPPEVKVSSLLQSPLFAGGFFSFQNPASLGVVSLLSVGPGMRVWDACAAPGGKTALLAEMDFPCRILASDISEARIKKMDDLFARLHLDGIETCILDVLNHSFDAEFDRILLDVPCSNLGVVSRRPESLYRLSSDDLKSLSEMQYRILAAASKALKPGGVLVYATCSPEPKETTQVIRRFLRENPHFETAGKPLNSETPEPGFDQFFAQALKRNA
jgi:16S rRNA (cytosine967-C5)-methyltransferase